jgi:tetratricopeptide (TPR) repeat protein
MVSQIRKCRIYRRKIMSQIALAPLLIILLIFGQTLRVSAQAGGGHTLFGDFKVEEERGGEIKTQTFQISLYAITGRQISRQTIGNNSRYRFFDVTNGEYYILVELEGQEVARIQFMVAENQRTDIQRDIQLEWRRAPGVSSNPRAGTVSAEEYYKRGAATSSLFDKAQEAARKKDYNQAASLFEQVVAADRGDFVAWTQLATLYWKNDKTEAAEKTYLQALEIKPDFILAFVNLGKLRIAVKNFQGAIDLLTKAVEAHPKSADVNLYLGEAYLQIKKGSKAVGYFNEAIRLDPIGKSEAHLRLATLYNAAGLKERAAAEYEQYLSKNPDTPMKKEIQKYISENKKRM